uniref:Uncharacterized protein n=1 Tax=Candidatus Kentrum sp. LPFa TaxID=2126335 RepID=A0A450WH80_9GAMM|nr:MAG: hypothetical protein BECKLPF1236B_GA0070989_109514 [Candidatus Kentron sp. LPFa]
MASTTETMQKRDDVLDKIAELLKLIHEDSDQREELMRQNNEILKRDIHYQEGDLKLQQRQFAFSVVAALIGTILIAAVLLETRIHVLNPMMEAMRGMYSDMSSVEGYMKSMRDDMGSMAGNMKTMAKDMQEMNKNVHGMKTDMGAINKTMAQMHDRMTGIEITMGYMGSNMGYMAGNVGLMGKNTSTMAAPMSFFPFGSMK